jgi:NADH:ubiquinone oxidoreductase subunit 6 (subunit J)
VAEKIDIDKLAEYNKLFKEGKIEKEEFNKIQEKYITQMKQLNQELEEATVATVSLAQAEAELAEMFGDTLGAYDANNEALRQAKELLEAAVSSTTELTEAQIEQIEAEYGNTEALKEAIEAMEAKKKAIDDLGPAYKKALKTSKPFFEDTATKLGLLSKKGNKFAKTLGSMFKMAGEEGGLKGLAKGFAEAFNPLNIGISIITKVVEATVKMMFAVDKAGASFTKTTGFARNFDGLIASTNERMRQFGVTADDAQKAIAGLRQGLSQFDTLGDSTQERLTDLVTGLEKIGVKGDDSIGVITSLNKSFGVSVDSATELTRELALSGDVLGKTASGITKDFRKTLGTLAVYGTKSVKIFKDIAAMAAAAGVEVDDMMGIANKFDTFADSAKTAAKMNAILGTSFSGVNMMMMDHDKRIETVIRGLQSTGNSFKNLDKFTQQAIATQLGIKDMDKANKILGMSVGEYKRLQVSQAASAKEQEALNEKMNQAMSVVDKLKVIMMDFAINMEKHGMIEKIRDLVEGFGNFIKNISPVGLLLTGLSSAFVGLALNTAGFITKIKLIEKFGGKAIEGVSKSIGKGLNIVANASKTASPALGTLSISMGGIALIIGTVAASVALITYSLAYLFNTMIQGIVTLKKVGAGFGDVALGIFAMVGAVGAMTLAVYGLAAAAKLLEKSPFGMVLGGILAGIMGATLGIGMLMTSSSEKAKPDMDMDDMTKSAETIGDLATKLQDLRDNKEDLQETFAAIGTGLQEAKAALSADIQATIANLAVMTTGHAAGEMTNYASAMALGAMTALLGPGGAIAAMAAGMDSGGSDGGVTKLQLDGPATTALLSGEIAKAHKATGNG